jgi:sigma-E factor negative regulatory protein RseB
VEAFLQRREAIRVRRTAYSSWWVLAFLLVSAGASALDESHPVAKPEVPKLEGAALLSHIQEAAQRQNYVGTFVYQVGGQMQSSRITHLAEASNELEKLEILDGKIREFIRHDDEVRCYLPDSKLLLIESRAKGDKFPAFLTAAAPDVDAYYNVSRGGVERVAGHNCNVIALEPRDGLRYGYRLWSDQETGLLLKAQTLDDHGTVLEQVGFTDVTIGGRIEKIRLKPTVSSTEGWRVEKFRSVPTDLMAQGWSVGAEPPGFRKIMEVRRTMGSGREVGQIEFSDGLAAISIFIEPLGGPNQTPGEATKGLINVLALEHGGHWLTVVGEVPAATIRQVAESVEFHPVK